MPGPAGRERPSPRCPARRGVHRGAVAIRGYVLGTNAIEADSLFTAYSDDGDWTNDDLRLTVGSPAIDTSLYATSVLDIDGGVRPVDGDGDGAVTVDLGAYEYAGDTDGDGYVDSAIGGDDCDDSDADVHPGAGRPLCGRDRPGTVTAPTPQPPAPATPAGTPPRRTRGRSWTPGSAETPAPPPSVSR